MAEMTDMLDKAKHLAKDVAAKARTAVSERSDTIDGGIDRAAGFVDGKTKHRYSSRIESVQAKAHELVGRIGDGGSAR
ncbi:MAG TPA: antitoxin [Acidimicrobiales bacterium]